MLKSVFLLVALVIVTHGVPPRFKDTVTEIENSDDELDCATFEGMTLSQNLCDPHFWQCTNGRLVRKTCPEGMKYDIENHHCNYSEKMNGCKKCEKTSEELATTNMNEAVGQMMAAVEKKSITTVEVDPTENGIDCETLGEVTIYKTLCGPYFWQCANGKLFRKTCPKGLMFNAEKNYCEYPERVRGCKEVKPGSPELSTSTYSMDDWKKEIFDFYCQNLEDDSYDMGRCLNTFVSCRGGHTKIIECTGGLVYDAGIKSCNYIGACKSEKNEVYLPRLFNYNEVLVKENRKNVEVKIAEPEIDCAFELMTISKHLCEPDFWQCTNGKLLKKTCPEGLVFDNEHHYCNYPEKVEGCQKINKISVASPIKNLDKTSDQPTAVEQSIEYPKACDEERKNFSVKQF